MADDIPPKDNFAFVDEVPEKGNPVNAPEYTCITCGTELFYGGRGRKPKYCDEHKPNRSSSSSTKRTSSAVVERAILELDALYSGMGLALKFVDETASKIVYDNSSKLAESYRMLLETNAKFRKLFLDIESKAAWMPILLVHGELIANIWIAHGLQRNIESVEDYANNGDTV